MQATTQSVDRLAAEVDRIGARATLSPLLAAIAPLRGG
jgi:hypothetical protein